MSYNARGLHLNDMVLYANSKPVGDMTEDELAVEMEICGSELLLIVSRYNGNPLEGLSLDINEEDGANAWRDLDKGAFDWQEIGPGSREIAPSSTITLSYSHGGGSEAPELTAALSGSLRRQVTFRDDAKNKGSARFHDVSGEGENIEHRASGFIVKTACYEDQEIDSSEDVSRMPSFAPDSMQGCINGHDLPAESDEQTSAGHNNEVGIVDKKYDGTPPDMQDSEESMEDGSLSAALDSQEDCSGNDEAPGLGIDEMINDFSDPKEAKTGKRDDNTSNKGPETVVLLPKSRKEIENGELAAKTLDKGSQRTGCINDGEDKNKSWDDEDNEDDPILGCICGETHEEPVEVFWLQCDMCHAWYNNSVQCIGFDEEEAEKMQSWICVSCGGEQPKLVHAGGEGKELTTNTDRDVDKEAVISIGSRVLVHCAQALYKGTVRKIRTSGSNSEEEYLIHFDGNRNSTTNWTPSTQIHSHISDEGVSSVNDDLARIQEQPKQFFTATACQSHSYYQDSEDLNRMTDSESDFLQGCGKEVHKQNAKEMDSKGKTHPPPESELKKRNTDVKKVDSSPNHRKKRKKAALTCFETVEEIDPDLIEFSCSGRIEKRRIDFDHKPIPVGSLVRVADRSATSPTKQGGVAKVMGRRGSLAERNLVYDVRYMVVNGREFDVSWQFVVPDAAFEDCQSSSPLGGSRRSRSNRRGDS